jgi:hypothetical protein
VHDDCMIQIAARVIEFDEAIDERLVGRMLHDSWGNDVSDLVQVPSQHLVEPDGDVGRGFLPADQVGESLEQRDQLLGGLRGHFRRECGRSGYGGCGIAA